MKIIECSGTPLEIGKAVGESLREEIRYNLEKLIKETDRKAFSDRLPIFYKVLQTCLPDILDEIRGMAYGANLPVDDIMMLNVEKYPDEINQEFCTNIVFMDGPDGPIWGKNNDGNGPPHTIPCIKKVRPKKGIPLVVFTFCGMVSTTDGMNAEGLAVGHSSVGSVFQQSDYHQNIRLWAYNALMKSRNTGEFIRNMTAVPLRGKGYSHVCVDRNGFACSLEAACPLVQVRMPKSKNGINCVNHYQLSTLKDADKRSPEQKLHSLSRQYYLDEIFKEKNVFDLKLMKELLRHHGNPSICGHYQKDLLDTEYSMIGLPAQGRILYVHGKPCESEFLSINID